MVEKHLKDYFQKKSVDVLFKKVTRIPTTTILFCTTYWGFMFFFFPLFVCFNPVVKKKCFSSKGFLSEGMERQGETFHMLEWRKSGEELEHKPQFLRSVSRLTCCWVSGQYPPLRM